MGREHESLAFVVGLTSDAKFVIIPEVKSIYAVCYVQKKAELTSKTSVLTHPSAILPILTLKLIKKPVFMMGKANSDTSSQA